MNCEGKKKINASLPVALAMYEWRDIVTTRRCCYRECIVNSVFYLLSLKFNLLFPLMFVLLELVILTKVGKEN